VNEDYREPPRDLQRIREAFSAAWDAGVRMPMAPFLEAVGPSQRQTLFRELLSAEVIHRRALGDEPKAEDYLQRYPLFAAIIGQVLPATSEPIACAGKGGTRLMDTAPCGDPAPGAAPDRLPEVPGYELVRLVGQGGMGIVYEAVHKATQRQVAVKMIAAAPTGNETQSRLFLREATTLSQLDHKRIVKFHEVGIVGGQLYLVMEYVDTIDLDTLLNRPDEPRTLRLSCGFICQVLEALAYAHGLGFVHRDVKPSNVLVCQQEGKYRTKLADFGLAKNFEAAGFSSVTTMGECRGTIGYMAPEQLTDAQWSQPAADIFSVSATLYHFFTGKTPYDFSGVSNPVMAVTEGRTIPLDQRRPDLPRPLIDLVQRGLARSPGDRFPSAAAMRRELIGFAQGKRS
jgi:eukaryotic-like serine/threonine-protein kinase